MGRRPKIIKKNTVAQTKLGVYSCPFLRIVENQEQGKDKRRIFCPGLLKTNSLSFFFPILLDFFLPFFSFFSFFGFFFGFFLFYFFGFSFFYFLIFLFFTTSRGYLLNWAYDPQAAKSGSHPLSSGLTSNCQFFSFFIWAYL